MKASLVFLICPWLLKKGRWNALVYTPVQRFNGLQDLCDHFYPPRSCGHPLKGWWEDSTWWVSATELGLEWGQGWRWGWGQGVWAPGWHQWLPGDCVGTILAMLCQSSRGDLTEQGLYSETIATGCSSWSLWMCPRLAVWEIILCHDLETFLRVTVEQRGTYVNEDAFTTDSRYTKFSYIDTLNLQLLDLYRIGNASFMKRYIP